MGGDGRGQGLNKRAPSCAPWVTTTWLLWLVFCVGAVIFLTLLAEARTRRSYSAADPICRLSDRERYHLYTSCHGGSTANHGRL